MLLTLAMGRVAIGLLCGAAVIVSLAVWFKMSPLPLGASKFPPVMRRGMYWWVGLTLGFAALAVAWLALRRPLGLPRTGVVRYVPLVLGLTPVLVVNPLYLWRTWWLRRAVDAADGRLCTHCAYDVNGLDEKGACPECGGAYDIEVDRETWLRVRRRGADSIESTENGAKAP